MEQRVDDEVYDSSWVEDYSWAGIVYPQDVRGNVVFITPLAYYYEGWQVITEAERNDYFPDNGKVTYFTRDFPSQGTNRLYYIQPETNQRPFERENALTYSRYLTHSYSEHFHAAEQLAQVLDWTSRSPNLFGLVDVLAQGFPLGDCLSQTIFIRYQETVYGPIHLEKDHYNPQTLKPHEYNQKSNPGGQPLLVSGFPCTSDAMIILVGQTFLDAQMLGSPQRQIDWSLPQTTIKRALRACKQIPDLQTDMLLVDRKINDLAALHAAHGPEAMQLEEAVIQRAQYIVEHQRERLEGLQTLIEELPEDHPLLVQARELEIQQRKEKIAQACEIERNDLHTLQKEKQATQDQLKHLKEQIKVASQQHEQQRAELAAQEDSWQERLAGLRAEMFRLLTDLQFTPTIPLLHPHEHGREIVAAVEPAGATATLYQQSYFSTGKVTTWPNPQDFPWAEIAVQNRVDTQQVKMCVATLLAGLIPAVKQLALLQAVAQGLAGQRIWRIPVPLTATEPLALFGCISGEGQAFVPVAGELADILLAAQNHPDQLGLIVLEGIDRVPFLPVIEPLLRQYLAVRQHVQQTGKATPCQETLQLFHPRALAPADPYQKLSQLAWPANMLLGVTFDHGLGCFLFPDAYTSWFVQLNPDKTDERVQGSWSGERKNWQVPAQNWHIREKENLKRATTRPHDLGLSTDFAPEQQVFGMALDFLGIRQGLNEIIQQFWPEQ